MLFPGCRSYPKELVINDDIWIVKFCKKIPERHYGREVIWGLCDPSEMVIYLRYRQKNFDLFCTFVHEMLHAIEHSYDIVIDRAADHPKVYILEKAIGQILKDNF